MSVIVRFPRMFHDRTGPEVAIDDPVHDVGAVRDVLQRRFPDVAAALDDPAFTITVNDVMLLPGVLQYPVKDGDVVEIVPAITGGSRRPAVMRIRPPAR